MEDVETKELKVSQVTSKKVMRDFVLDYCLRSRRIPGKMDDELDWIAGPEGKGVYVGELNGQKVTGVGMIQHNDSYGWVGMYFCEEEHRGKGLAFKTWKTARAAIDPKLNLGLDGIVSKAHLYEREGFKRAWNISVDYLFVSSILEVYDNMTAPDGIIIKSATEVDFAKLKLYTEDVIGVKFDRPGLLEKWITLPTHTALAAVNDNGDVVGFGTIRETINFQEDGYRLGPLLADNGDIARFLLLKLAQGVNLALKFVIFILYETNAEAKKILNELKKDHYADVVRMYTGDEPPLKKEKYFGTFSIELVG